MSQSQFSLTWEEYKRNICNGLSSLQQNGEFVDMTLAADGHFVKVHQVIIALASPFLKELISSVQCPHPILFLNKVSYRTLCSVLEYIYTGEVLVSIDNLNDLIDAGRELHIKGLEDMTLQQQLPKSQLYYNNSQESQASNMEGYDEEVCYFEVSNPKSDDDHSQLEFETKVVTDCKKDIMSLEDQYNNDDTAEITDPDYTTALGNQDELSQKSGKSKSDNLSVMQYTVSNQGSLQMILNRFVYYLKHTNRNSTRQWRCVDYVSRAKCPAHVVTKDDIVLQRIAAHTHAFHDQKILKKVQAGAIFSAIQEAVKEGSSKRKKNNSPAASNTEDFCE